MFLTRAELKQLTERVQYAAQVKVLRSLRIEHRQRPDGSIAVLKNHVEQVMSGSSNAGRLVKPAEPDWGALDAVRKK